MAKHYSSVMPTVSDISSACLGDCACQISSGDRLGEMDHKARGFAQPPILRSTERGQREGPVLSSHNAGASRDPHFAQGDNHAIATLNEARVLAVPHRWNPRCLEPRIAFYEVLQDPCTLFATPVTGK